MLRGGTFGAPPRAGITVATMRLTFGPLTLPLLTVVLLTVGCAGPQHGAAIRVDPDLPGKTRTVRFDAAYAEQSKPGQYDVILVDEGAAREKQVVYLRAIPTPGRSGPGAAPERLTNATFDWYVFAPGPTGADDVLKYSGTGRVRAAEDDVGLWVSIDGGTMSFSGWRGSAEDALGPASIDGSFYAYLDPKRMGEALHEVLRATNDIRRLDGPDPEVERAE